MQTIQGRTASLIDRAAAAMTDMLDAIREAEAAGATPEQLAPIFELAEEGDVAARFHQQRELDGLPRRPGSRAHSGESIDYSRQAQAAATRLQAQKVPPVARNSP